MAQLLCSLLTILLLAASASAQPRETAAAPHAVTTGEGVVRTVPDRAFVSITAEARAKSPRDAQQRSTELMKPVLDKLRGAGIPDDAIRTTAYDLQQEWDYVDNRRVSRGYVARNTVEVRVDAIDKLGALLDTAVSAGATSLGDIRFDLKERDKLEREALRLAVADARARAEAVAAGAGAAVARIVRIEEHGTMPPPAPPIPMMRTAMREEAAAADVPIAPGQLELRARVSLTVELK